MHMRWAEFATAAPEMAAIGREQLEARRVVLIATVRPSTTWRCGGGLRRLGLRRPRGRSPIFICSRSTSTALPWSSTSTANSWSKYGPAVPSAGSGTVDHSELRYADSVRQSETPEAARVRIDKWLWAARFFKTRSLAAEAVDGGKVHVNGDRVKAARPLKPGDRLSIRRGPEEVELVVLALDEQRGPAVVAEALYQETEASVARRLALADERRMHADASPRLSGRPDKKSRRAIVRFTRRG